MEGELTGYLGLGSNQGDRLRSLRAARAALEARADIEVTGASSVYETVPQDEAAGQPDFLNACLRVETALRAEEVLAACKEIERELGRQRGGPRHGPRSIDVDVLLLGDLEHRSEHLQLPHPRLADRRFVLAPLLELDPGLRLPDGTPLDRLIEAVRGQRVERAGRL